MENIDDKVSVNLFSNHTIGSVFPTGFFWRGRSYRIQKVGLHHTFREGRSLVHVFSVTDGTTFFKLEMNTETLLWRLVEVETDSYGDR